MQPSPFLQRNPKRCRSLNHKELSHGRPRKRGVPQREPGTTPKIIAIRFIVPHEHPPIPARATAFAAVFRCGTARQNALRITIALGLSALQPYFSNRCNPFELSINYPSTCPTITDVPVFFRFVPYRTAEFTLNSANIFVDGDKNIETIAF